MPSRGLAARPSWSQAWRVAMPGCRPPSSRPCRCEDRGGRAHSAGIPTPGSGINGQGWTHNGTQSFPERETVHCIHQQKGERRVPWFLSLLQSTAHLCGMRRIGRCLKAVETAPCHWGASHPLAREDNVCKLSTVQLCRRSIGERRHSVFKVTRSAGT